MKCETCDQLFPDEKVKIKNGKKLCPECFEILTSTSSDSSTVDPNITHNDPAFREDAATAIVAGGGAMLAVYGETTDERIISSVVNSRMMLVSIMAEDLGIPITEAQALSIARNNLSPAFIEDPVPLSDSERSVALEICYHAWKLYANKEGSSYKLTEEQLRDTARRSVAAGERGCTTLMKVASAGGCFQVIMFAILGTGFAIMSMAILVVMS